MQNYFLNIVISRIRRDKDILAILCIVCLVGLFFNKTIAKGMLPVPSDTLVGLYYPYRDAYSKSYPNGIPFKNFLITDPVRQQIPWRKTVINDIKAGKLPLWNAFSFSGTPLFANIQSGALYPLNILFLIFPFEIAWSLLIISQQLLAGIFLFLFLRNKHLGVLPALFGAICFAFSGFSVSWLTWGTIVSTWLWTPLSLFALDKIHMDRKWYWGVLMGFSIVFSFFAGHLQLFIYSMLVIAAYAVWGTIPSKDRPWMLYVAVIAGIVLVTAPQWIAMLKWLPQTSRVAQGAAWKVEGFFIPVWHLIQFIAPDYFGNPATLNYWGVWNYGEMIGYVGIAGLTLAAVGMSMETLFWSILILVALVLSVASPISFLPFQLHIPFVTLLQPTRLLAVVDLGLSVLAAYGFSEIMNGKHRKRLILVLVGLFSSLVVIWGSVFLSHVLGISPEHMFVAKRNIIIPTLLIIGLFFLLLPLIVIKKDRIRKCYIYVFGIVLIMFLIFDLFRFGWKFTPFTDRAYFFPQTKILSFLEEQKKPFRIIATDDRILPPNVNEYYDIESIAGYDPIHSSRYEEFIAALERGVPNINPPFGYDRIITPKNIHSPLLQLLNIRYVVSFDDLTTDGFRKVEEEGQTKVFENTHLVPRVYLSENVKYKKGKQEVINALYDKSFIPGFSTVVESPIQILSVPLSLNESAIIQKYNDEAMIIEARVDSPRLLVIGNMYDSGWIATVDSVKTEIFRVNYLFMGVIVPAGNHTVTFSYN